MQSGSFRRVACGVGVVVGFWLGGCGEEVRDGLGGLDDAPIGTVESALKVCIQGELVHGIDVSEYQENIDWDAVARAGTRFAFVRLSYGVSRLDATFAENWPAAKKAGVIRGAYQFFRPSQDATAQAELLVKTIGQLETGDLPPVIDVETDTNLPAPSVIAEKVGTWLAYVESKLGVRPIVYTGKYFWQDYVQSSAFRSYPLWLPNYFSGYEGNCPNTPDPWTDWQFWQWSDKGSVSGISGAVDRDIFKGSYQALLDMTVGAGSQCGNGFCDAAETTTSCDKDCRALSLKSTTDGATVANPVALTANADSRIQKVAYVADAKYELGLSGDASGFFPVSYTFNTLGLRSLSARGMDASDQVIARSAAISVTIVAEAGEDGGVAEEPVGADESVETSEESVVIEELVVGEESTDAEETIGQEEANQPRDVSDGSVRDDNPHSSKGGGCGCQSSRGEFGLWVAFVVGLLLARCRRSLSR